FDWSVLVVRAGAPDGNWICSAWIPLHAVSMGNNVNVPLCLTRTALQPPKNWLYHFSMAMRSRQPPPMTVIGLPYSLLVHVDVSLAMIDVPQFIVDACMRPKLWPISCPVAVQNVPLLFSQTYLPGRSCDPSAPHPAPQFCMLAQ